MKIHSGARDVGTPVKQVVEQARAVMANGGTQGRSAIVGRFYFSPRRYSYGFRFDFKLGEPRELDGGTWFVPEQMVSA